MRKRIVLSAALLLILSGCILAACFYTGVLLFNNPSKKDYPVRGGDVSSYQGEIDWPLLAEQDIQFAFIKATEGSSLVDPCFESNYAGAAQTALRIGAYHFFSYDSSGEAQADLFTATVPPLKNMLPPVIDVEFYGDKETHPPDRAEVMENLTVMIRRLEEHYGMTPILYATEKSYRLYLADAFEECDIWIRDVVSRPVLSDGREWTFWQYANRGRLKGYAGREPYIDLNVWQGDAEEFAAYPSSKGHAPLV